MSERTEGRSGKRETARAAFLGHRAMEAGPPRISSEGAMCRLDMEVDRLLCDDGPTVLWRPTAGKASRDRRVTGWAANGQHTGSRMGQENHRGAPNRFWTVALAKIRDAETKRMPRQDRRQWACSRIDEEQRCRPTTQGLPLVGSSTLRSSTKGRPRMDGIAQCYTLYTEEVTDESSNEHKHPHTETYYFSTRLSVPPSLLLPFRRSILVDC